MKVQKILAETNTSFGWVLPCSVFSCVLGPLQPVVEEPGQEPAFCCHTWEGRCPDNWVPAIHMETW